MPARQTAPGPAGAWVKILEETEEYAFGALFRIFHVRLQFRRFDGRLSDPITRITFVRGDTVGVLLYDSVEDTVVLVRQFRYPVFASLSSVEQQGAGAQLAWTLEIVAGVQDAGATVKEVANKELLEEAGYVVTGELRPIATIYPSPGGTSERIHLFWGEVNRRQQAAKGGGIVAEGEDLEVMAVPFGEALGMVTNGAISDAKTIIALQALALRKMRTAKP